MSSRQILVTSSLSKSFSSTSRAKLLLSYLGLVNTRPKSFEALSNVSFTLDKGETVGIIGRNGAGKSTLLQIICGTLSPSSGSISVEGRVAALLELGAGFNPEFTGRENIYLNAAIYGLTRSEIDEKLDAIIEFSGIGDFVDQPVQHYSSGMFVRLAFSVIAHVDADILIIDEALAVGDALFAQKCIRFLEEFKKKGSILFVSHDSGAITRLCDRAIWLEKGHMRMIGDASEVSEAYLEYLYSQQQDVEQVSTAKTLETRGEYSAEHSWVDARDELFQQSTLRNDIDILRFDENGKAFGSGAATIADVLFRNTAGQAVSWVVGGSQTSLEVVIHPETDIDNLIVGFLVKNRQGQVLFGENNCVFDQDTPLCVKAGKHYRTRFTFIMPYLPEGDYVISVGVASGTQLEHVQHCWRHDALVFSVTGSHVVHGLFGVPVAACETTPID